jgi:hypothetical protein
VTAVGNDHLQPNELTKTLFQKCSERKVGTGVERRKWSRMNKLSSSRKGAVMFRSYRKSGLPVVV